MLKLKYPFKSDGNRLGKRQTVSQVPYSCTVEPRYNEPLYNEVLDITNNLLHPSQNYSKMYGTEPRFNEILVITNTIHKREHNIYLDITNKYQHMMKDEINAKQTNKDNMYVNSSFKQFCLPVLKFLVP